MKTIKLFTIFALILALSALCSAQTALSTTTLGAAITSTNTTSITLASTSTMQSAGPVNQVNTCFYVDKELFGVTTVVDSTHVIVQQRGRGCGAIGASARPTTHLSGAKVYFANTVTNGNTITPAASYIGKNDQPTAENFGSCTATNELALPKIFIFSGDIMDCKNGSSGGQWILTGIGTSATAGKSISIFCTGTVGSSETEYLNGAACSGSTNQYYHYVVQNPGTLANLQVYSSAAVVGGSSVDVLTVYKNGSATSITCTIAASGTSCTDGIGTVTGHSVAVIPGDAISFKFVTAGSDTAANISVALGLY